MGPWGPPAGSPPPGNHPGARPPSRGSAGCPVLGPAAQRSMGWRDQASAAPSLLLPTLPPAFAPTPTSHHTAQGRWNRWPPTGPTGLALPGRLPGSLFFARPRPPQEHWGFPWVLPSLPPVCHSALSHSTGTTRPQPPRRRKCREGEPAGRGEAALRGEVVEGGLGRGAHLPRSGSEGLLGT